MLSQVFYGAGTIILKGYSSTVQNAVAILRNLTAMKNVKSKVVEWTLILLGVVLGIIFNNRGLISWLPVVANLEYSVAATTAVSLIRERREAPSKAQDD